MSVGEFQVKGQPVKLLLTAHIDTAHPLSPNLEGVSLQAHVP